MQRPTILSLVLVLLLVTPGLAKLNQDDEVNAPEKLIKSVAFLEQRPLDNKAKDLRSWALKWIAASDKVNVKVCSLLVSGVDKNYKYSGEIVGQYSIGMAAFKLAYPARANEEDAAQLYGVQSALTAYATILRTHPQNANAFLDNLVSKRNQGDFGKYVKDHNCQGNN